jgi:hypothetical protein
MKHRDATSSEKVDNCYLVKPPENSIRQIHTEGVTGSIPVASTIFRFAPSILGEVTRPGEYPYADGLSVLNTVANANGFT